MEFIKVNTDSINLDIKINNTTEIYLLKNNEILLGYGLIDETLKENIIYIYVYEEYRGNGYGKEIFNYLYKELKNKGIKELIFNIDNSNTNFINIISNYNAIHLGTNNNIVKYIITIK